VGARKFLIAYNLFLDRPELATARAIARELRASNGGLIGVKAMGVLVQGRAQISLNITDFRLTPVGHAFAAVRRLASSHGTKVVDGELIGLLPEEAYERDSEWVRLINGFTPEERILERRLKQPLPWPIE
jgi:glutamate formiminotransferase / 5-formyltetrahydrofolate cyclo-ligase